MQIKNTTLRITTRGKLFLALTILIGIGAVNTANNLLFIMLGFLLGIIIISGILSELNLYNIDVSYYLPEIIWSQKESHIIVKLRNNKKIFPSYAIEIEDVIHNIKMDKRCYFLKVGNRSQQKVKYEFIHNFRGKFNIIGYKLITRYPYGLFEKEKFVKVQNKYIEIFPSLIKVSLLDIKNNIKIKSYPYNLYQKVQFGEDIDSVKEYTPGDDAHLIHWKTTARRQKLMVKEFESLGGANDITLYLETLSHFNYEPPHKIDSTLEKAISYVTTFCVTMKDKGYRLQIVTREGKTKRLELNQKNILYFLRFLTYINYVTNKDLTFPQIPQPTYSILVTSKNLSQYIDNIKVDKIVFVENI